MPISDSTKPLLNDQGQEVDAEGMLLPSPELVMLRTNKLDAWNYRFRKVYDWDQNYELYRDKVITDRLLQRQSVYLPIMKTQIKTLLKDVDDMPIIEYQSLDNDESAEIFLNEYWKYTQEQNKMEIKDIVDKKQEMLFGRSYDQWQIIDGMVRQTIQDPYDILVQRYADPTDINTSRFLIHMHIFTPLSSLDKNPDYNKRAIEDMQKWYQTRLGIVKASENARFLVQRNQRQADLGVPDINAPMTGETYVELALHFVFRDHEPILGKDGKPTGKEYPPQIFLYVECENMRILMKKPLEEVIGVTSDHFWRNHYPYTSWADDVERQDWYSDAIADIIRVPNQIMNAWFSQEVENRSLKNLNMHIFNSNIEGFQPQTWQPMAWGMYGIPLPQNANIADVFQELPVGDLSDNQAPMEFIQSIIDKATGATPTQQGAQTPGELTLGEIKLTLANAQQRVKGMSKFYTQVWKERALIFLKLIEAAPNKLDAVKLYKKGKNTKSIFTREVTPNDWITKSGYGIKIWSQDERDAMDVDSLNKLNAVKTNMPDNPKLEEIYDRKLLEFAGLRPDEISDVMKIELEHIQNAQNGVSSPSKIPTESMQLPYQLVPDDIKRQMERAFGFIPSKMGNTAVTSPQPNNPSTSQPNVPQQPLQLPSQIGQQVNMGGANQ